jgi:hypothetical protein
VSTWIVLSEQMHGKENNLEDLIDSWPAEITQLHPERRCISACLSWAAIETYSSVS